MKTKKLGRTGHFGQPRRDRAERMDDKVYTPDIINSPGKVYKQPGYKPS